MSSSSPQHEPTMEEILASIRKIISEDAAPEAAAPKQDNDVLELTQEVTEEPAPPPQLAAEPEPPPASQSEPTPAVQPENDVVFVSHEESTVTAPSETPDHDGIFSDKARKAIDDAFAGLDDADEQPAAEAPKTMAASVDGNSVEAVFERAVRSSVEPLLNQWMDGHRDELMSSIKPLLRDWMDEHFPALLEGAVRDEVARVVKARGRR